MTRGQHLFLDIKKVGSECQEHLASQSTKNNSSHRLTFMGWRTG